MCGRYSLDASIDVLIERYKASRSTRDFEGQEEVFPTNSVPIVINNGNNEVKMMKWGFTFEFTKRPIINARAETVDIKPSFRYAFFNKRCIIPVTSFFEWENIDGRKIKRRISIEEDIFSLAGLYNTFQDKEGKLYEAFTIVTTEANEHMKEIHHRMPVIIPKGMEKYWLDRKFNNIDALKSMMQPYKGKVIIV
ncbi:MAG: SOS response-associated peptidase [Tissierellia bacterium]|nr:SOS response-associated peptidase [Tissierellia bacterium]